QHLLLSNWDHLEAVSTVGFLLLISYSMQRYNIYCELPPTNTKSCRTLQKYPDSKYAEIAKVKIKSFDSRKHLFTGNKGMDTTKTDVLNHNIISKPQEDEIVTEFIYVPVSGSGSSASKPNADKTPHTNTAVTQSDNSNSQENYYSQTSNPSLQEDYIYAPREIVNSNSGGRNIPPAYNNSSKKSRGKWSVDRIDLDQTFRAVKNIFGL
ncbi:MAG: hypothetical protein IJV06_07260, partial [Bacteroidaceae bacterium]|nr:hypothetical protein [Bacteroidaceae bacterium]